MFQRTALAGLMLSTSIASASSLFGKRDSWGPAYSLGPSKAGIISTTTTIYPGAMPADQAGLLYLWLGISNGTGDLIQSVIGSYPAGESECQGQTGADTTWCVSSEVYGLTTEGLPNQWVGALTTADLIYENGIKLTYTLADSATYLWTQTMEDAVTGTLLSSFNKTSGPMLGWGTAIECNDDNGVACIGTVSEQSYVNSTIVLESADATFIETLGVGEGVNATEMVTADDGKTWTIAKIVIPAMVSGGTAASASGVASSTSSVKIAAAPTSTQAISSTPAQVTTAPIFTTLTSQTKHHDHTAEYDC